MILIDRICIICNSAFKASKSNVTRGYGITCSRACAYKKIAKDRTGVKNWMWKENVGYASLHEWVSNQLVKPQACRDCNQPKPLDLANISQEYKRDLTDWEWLCRRCHMKKDGRLSKFMSHSKPFTRHAKFKPSK